MNDVSFLMPSMEGGGAERVVSILCNYFAEEGYKVKIYLLNKDVIDYELDSRVKIDKTNVQDNSGIKKKVSRLLGIRKILRDNPNSTIISFFSMYNLYTLSASIGLKNRIIVSERLDPRKSLPNNRVLFEVRNFLYKRAHKIVFQTPDAKDFFPKNIQGKGVVIANPLKDGLPERFIGERRHEVVTFARLEPQKNYPLLLDAFEQFSQRHPDYILKIYGKGTMEEKLKDIVCEKGMEEKVQFNGFVKNLHETIRGAMMFVLPSDYEGLSNSMLEALAIGLPCVCTDCPPGGAKMFIKSGENGILVPVRDSTVMCEAMCRIAEQEDFRNRLSINAEKLRFELTTESICAKWNELMN